MRAETGHATRIAGPNIRMTRPRPLQLHMPHSLAAPFIIAELLHGLALVPTACQRLDAVDHTLALLPTACRKTSTACDDCSLL
jgi:hypothetical protein